MAQLNFYVPNDLEEKIKQEAKAKGKSVSQFLAELVKKQINSTKSWPSGFFDQVAGKWQGDFPDIEDLPSQEREF